MTRSVTYLCMLGFVFLSICQTMQTKCWTTNCPDKGEGEYCVQHCLPGATHCIANYLSHADGTISPGLFQCYTPPNPADCTTSTCNPVPSPGGVSSCCCTGDLCNEVPGLTPGSVVTVPPFPTSVPTGTVPVRPDTHLICEFYNCSLVTDPSTQTCYHGYQVCAEGDVGMAIPDHDSHSCQALYRYNNSLQLYETYTKGCRYNSIPPCTGNECYIDSDITDPREQFVSCCCDGHLCNRNVTFEDPNVVIPGVAPECGGLNCNHSCIIENGVPRCFCTQGHFLSETDNSTCFDVDECATGAHLCEPPATCVNQPGTYSCDCDAADNLRISSGGRSCERTGLVCEEFRCTSLDDCSGPGVQYCDDIFLAEEEVDFSKEYCQATYTLLPDGTAMAGLLSCQLGTQISGCTEDYCDLRVLDSHPDILYCCCTGTLCNRNVSIPSFTHSRTVTTLAPSPTPTEATPQPIEKKQADIITFASVVAAAVVLIAVFVVVAIICFYRRHQKRSVDPYDPFDPEVTTSAASPFLSTSPILMEKIGRGKFATVFKGKLPDCFVAVKCFENSVQGRDSFTRELEIYKTPELSNRNILQFLGYETMDSHFWLVFEYHAQGSLCDLLKQRTVTLDQFLDLAESAAAGLAYLHNEKIVDDKSKKPAIAHRDLKSKNILVKTNGQCCISDLGLAIQLDQGENLNDAHGQVGTSRYMAPEVLEGAINFQREAFLRIDIYALGLILYEISTRTALPNANVEPYRPPFDDFVSSNPTIEEMTTIVVQQQRRPEIPVCFRVDLELDTIAETIQEAWDHDAEARLSAQCIEERIRTFRSNHVSKACPQVSKSREEVSKDSGRETDSDPFSQLPDTPSLSSSVTMSPLEPKPSVTSGDPFMNASRIAASNETVCLSSFRQGTQQQWNENRRLGMMSYSHSTETTV